MNENISLEQEQQVLQQQVSLHLSRLNFNPSRDAFVRLIQMPKNHVTNVSFVEINNRTLLYHQHVFTKQFGRIPHNNKRWDDQRKITIGRHCQGFVSDIQLNDGFTSVGHCVIYVEGGWDDRKKLTKEFVTFLFGTRSNILIKNLNKDLLQVIWSYAKPVRQFYIQDLGSKYGTMLKFTKKIMKQGMIFVLPESVTIKVIQIQITNQDNFIQLQIMNQTHFLRLKQPSQKITFGRHESNNIVLNYSGVSRWHGTISFDENNWIITDGVNGNPSANGLYYDIRTINEANNRIKTELIKLQPQDMIIIGNSYLKFEAQNCSY